MEVLVTDATGYIGGRLIPRLLAGGHVVRAMTRDAGRLRDVPWASEVEVVVADTLGDELSAALDAVDVAYLPRALDGELLRLRAEMKVPGAAWLELKVEVDDSGCTRYVQRALFHPRGLAGHAYWWAVAPFHGVVFGGMLANIAGEARRVGLRRRVAA